MQRYSLKDNRLKKTIKNTFSIQSHCHNGHGHRQGNTWVGWLKLMVFTLISCQDGHFDTHAATLAHSLLVSYVDRTESVHVSG